MTRRRSASILIAICYFFIIASGTAHCSDAMFMLVTLNPDATMLSLDILSYDILSLDILSSDIALSPCIIPVTLTLWPTCSLRSSELISSTPSGCFLFLNIYLPSFSAIQPVIVICLPMASDFFIEKSPVIAISPNNETEHASISMVIQYMPIFILFLLN